MVGRHIGHLLGSFSKYKGLVQIVDVCTYTAPVISKVTASLTGHGSSRSVHGKWSDKHQLLMKIFLERGMYRGSRLE